MNNTYTFLTNTWIMDNKNELENIWIGAELEVDAKSPVEAYQKLKQGKYRVVDKDSSDDDFFKK